MVVGKSKMVITQREQKLAHPTHGAQQYNDKTTANFKNGYPHCVSVLYEEEIEAASSLWI